MMKNKYKLRMKTEIFWPNFFIPKRHSSPIYFHTCMRVNIGEFTVLPHVHRPYKWLHSLYEVRQSGTYI